MTGWLDQLLAKLAKWRRGRKIHASDSGIFDPYLPINSIKPLSENYEPPLETALSVAADPGEAYSSDRQPEKQGLMIFRLLVVMLAAVLCFRLISLQIVQGQQNYSLAEGNRLKTEPIPALRGLFYDRNGVALVKNVANYSVVLNVNELPAKATLEAEYIKKLATVLVLDEVELKKKITSARNLSQLTLADNLSRDQAMELQLKLNGAGLTGVSLLIAPVREYGADIPDLGHILGYIGKTTADDLKERPSLLPTSYVGKSGLELQYDELLQGTSGINTVEVDSLGRALRVVGNQPAVSGQSLILGLDSELQKVAANALKTSIEANHATSGAAVVMDTRTGDILAMASAPTFDNNLFSQSGDKAARSAALTDPLSPLLNRVIAGQYPAGSTVKPLIAAGALQAGVISASTKFDTAEPITAGAQTFTDWKKHGISDVKLAIAQSNDIFFYTIGGGRGTIQGLGIDRLANYLEKFNFGAKTGIDLPGEKAGNVPTPAWKQKVQHDRWYLGDTYNLSIGQGSFLITPLQLTSAITSIANGGTIFQPKLVKSVIGKDGQPREVAPAVKERGVVDSANIDTVRQGMRQTVQPGGTAYSILGSLPVTIAAKTGTAQTSASLTNTHAWFTAFAPYEVPEMAVSVVVEGGGEGFDVAGPVARQIIQQYFHLPLTPIVAGAHVAE